MDRQKLNELIEQGENATVEFKSAEVRAESVAREMVAFANTHGGTLLLGVEDSGALSGVTREGCEEWIANIARSNVVPALAPSTSVLEVAGKKIWVVEVSRGPHKPYQTVDGKFWIRVGSTNRQATKEELSRLFQMAGLVHFDISPVESTGLSDLEPKLLDSYWRTCYQIPYLELDAEEQLRILQNADILVPLDQGWAVSIGGLLVFGKDPQRRAPQASVVFAVYRGASLTDELIDKKTVEGTLPELVERTAALVKLFLPSPSTVEGLQRKEHEAIPQKVIREALVNAVCHRDYSIVNQRISVYLFGDRLEITSPGRLGNTLSIEKIKVGNSAPRNMFLLRHLDNLRYIDGLGRGVPMMLKIMGPNLSLEEIGELFRVTLRY